MTKILSRSPRHGTAVTLKPTGGTVSLRDGFTGQEDQDPDFSVPYLDFGARQYSPSLSRWLVPDPMGEKYYDVSPYAYCAGNPVSLVDPEGKDIVPRQLAESLGTIPNYQYSRLLDDNYGPYSVYAYYDSNDNIVGYGATKDVRHGQNSISRFDYIMTSESDLSLFSDNVSLYSIAADIFNANHEPTPGELNIISGHILKGLVMEWREALSNPIYWLNTISILGISCLSLQSSLTIEQVINKSTPCGRAKNGWRIRTRDGNLMDDYISLSKTYNGSFKESNGYNSFYTQDFVVGYHKSTSTGIPTLDINSKTLGRYKIRYKR